MEIRFTPARPTHFFELVSRQVWLPGTGGFIYTPGCTEMCVPPEDVVALRKLNEKLRDDTGRVFVVQINIGDGYTLATKLW